GDRRGDRRGPRARPCRRRRRRLAPRGPVGGVPGGGQGRPDDRGRRQGGGGDTGREAACRSEGAVTASAGGPRVWAMAQLRGGGVTRASGEAVAAARRLAAALGGAAEAVLLGSGIGGAAGEMARRGLAAVHVADHPTLAAYTPGAWIGVLAPALA